MKLPDSVKELLFICALAATVLVGCSGEEVVSPENNPPELTPLGDQNATVGNPLSLTFQATDRDGDAITYHLTVLIGGVHDTLPNARIDSKTGAFDFTPGVADKPFREFVVEARDGRGGEDFVRFKVNVSD
jgi:hypothetical protein